MSPEQARGKPARQADRHLGVRLRALRDADRPARVRRRRRSRTRSPPCFAREPDWSALPDDVSDAIRVLLKRCLLKDRQQRVANFGVARFVMSETSIARVERGSAIPPPRVSAPLGTKLVLAGIAGLIIGALVAGGGAILASRRTPPLNSRRRSV